MFKNFSLANTLYCLKLNLSLNYNMVSRWNIDINECVTLQRIQSHIFFQKTTSWYLLLNLCYLTKKQLTGFLFSLPLFSKQLENLKLEKSLNDISVILRFK